MHALDLTLLVAYLAGTVLFGAYFSRSQRTVRDYFVTGHRVPWWAIMGSIVATETSTVTFISVPGFAYGGNLTFLQLVAGYLVGRVVVSLLFIPAYFRGELLTVYQLLGERFGPGVKQLASLLFLATRSLADGFRLFATGLVLAALLLSSPLLRELFARWLPFLEPATAGLLVAVLVIGGATILYTFLGGMSAVIWTDLTQLVVYLGGAVAAAVILIDQIPGGWAEVVRVGAAAGKFELFDFGWDVTRSYTFWSGVVGGAFFTTASHGTDQMIVQRYLCGRSARDATLALLVSGVVVFLQFTLFLVIGVMLFVYYEGYAPAEIARFTVDGRLLTDRIFPTFIVTHLPPGAVGLVCAAVFAAAMSTLSSSLNSSAAASVGDFYLPLTGGRHPDRHYLAVARRLTVVWGGVQIAVALTAIQVSSRVVDEVLGIASFTNGVVLGLFLLGTLSREATGRSAFVGALAGAIVMIGVKLLTGVSWQWYVLIGSLVTFLVGDAARHVLRGDRPASEPPTGAR